MHFTFEQDAAIKRLTSRKDYVGGPDPFTKGGKWYHMALLKYGGVPVLELIPPIASDDTPVVYCSTVVLGLPLDASNPRIDTMLAYSGKKLEELTTLETVKLMHYHMGGVGREYAAVGEGETLHLRCVDVLEWLERALWKDS